MFNVTWDLIIVALNRKFINCVKFCMYFKHLCKFPTSILMDNLKVEQHHQILRKASKIQSLTSDFFLPFLLLVSLFYGFSFLIQQQLKIITVHQSLTFSTQGNIIMSSDLSNDLPWPIKQSSLTLFD